MQEALIMVVMMRREANGERERERERKKERREEREGGVGRDEGRTRSLFRLFCFEAAGKREFFIWSHQQPTNKEEEKQHSREKKGKQQQQQRR